MTDIDVPEVRRWRLAPREDTSELVGLHRPGVLVAAAVIWAGFAVLGLTSPGVDAPALYVAAFVAIGLAWAVTLGAPGSPLRIEATIAAVAAGTVGVAGVIASVEPVIRGPLVVCAGATAILTALLCLRGRSGAAWVSFGLLLVVLAVGGAMRADPVDYLVIVAPGNLGIVLLLTVFSRVVDPRAEQIFALRRQARRESTAITVRAVRDQQLARLDDRVRPLLEAMASGDRLDDRRLAQVRLVEAQLRDRIRAPGLDVPDVCDAVWAARARGVRVILLDDGRETDEDTRARLLARVRAAAVEVLDSAVDGCEVTVRIAPAGREIAATVAVACDGAVERREFS